MDEVRNNMQWFRIIPWTDEPEWWTMSVDEWSKYEDAWRAYVALGRYYREMEGVFLNAQYLSTFIRTNPSYYEVQDISLYTEAQTASFLPVFWYGSVIMDIGKNWLWRELEKTWMVNESHKKSIENFGRKYGDKIDSFGNIRDYFTHPFSFWGKTKVFDDIVGHQAVWWRLTKLFLSHSQGHELKEVDLEVWMKEFRSMFAEFLEIVGSMRYPT